MGIRADRKPVDAAILVHEIAEVRIIDGTGGVGGGQVHEAVFQRAGIMEGKPAAGDNIRQSSVFIQEPVEIQVIVPDYKFNIDIRKLLLDIGGVFFIELCGPQIHGDGFRVLFFRALSAATRQQQHSRDPGQQHG